MFIARLKPSLADKQAMWTAVAIAAFALTLILVRDVQRLEYFRYTFALAGVALLLLPLVPGIGYATNGSRIWAHLGPMTFQPGELAKITLAIFLASYFVERRELLSVAGRDACSGSRSRRRNISLLW